MAQQLNHVSIVAHELETSLRFYVDELGLEPVATPDFGFPVIWLAIGDRQLHRSNDPVNLRPTRILASRSRSSCLSTDG